MINRFQLFKAELKKFFKVEKTIIFTGTLGNTNRFIQFVCSKEPEILLDLPALQLSSREKNEFESRFPDFYKNEFNNAFSYQLLFEDLEQAAKAGDIIFSKVFQFTDSAEILTEKI